MALVFVVFIMFWFKFWDNRKSEPQWLRVVANAVLVILSLVSRLYLLGVAT